LQFFYSEENFLDHLRIITKTKLQNTMKKISDYKSYDEWVAATIGSSKKQMNHFLKVSLEDFEKDGDIAILLLALRQITKVKLQSNCRV
jgi:hypothetical protein